VLSPAWTNATEKRGGDNLEKSTAPSGGLFQKWMLKMELKGRRRTLRAWENRLKMFDGLQ
jgi:hypothetical protein